MRGPCARVAGVIGVVAGVAGVAAGAGAQTVTPARFALEIVPVARRYTPNPDGTLTATDIAGPVRVDPTNPDRLARTVRIEMRYRISVTGSTTGSYTSGSTTWSSGGLGVAMMNVTFSTPLPAGSLAPAPMGTNRLGAPGYADPDTAVDAGAGYGLYAPWRTGPVYPTGFGKSNGILGPTGITEIIGISTSPGSNQHSTFTDRFWSFYAFDFTVPMGWSGDSSVTFWAKNAYNASGGLGNWFFFPRNGTATLSAPVRTADPFREGAITIGFGAVPAPGAAWAVCGAGVIAARRRRRRG